MALEKLKLCLRDPLASDQVTDRKAVAKFADGTAQPLDIDALGWVQFLVDAGSSGTVEFTDTNVKGNSPTTSVPFQAAQYPAPTAPPAAPAVLGWG